MEFFREAIKSLNFTHDQHQKNSRFPHMRTAYLLNYLSRNSQFARKEMGETMARHSAKLNALTVKGLKTPGLFSDGAGLNLRVSDTGTKSWVLRYMLNG